MIWVVDAQEINVVVSAKGEVEVLQWNEQKKVIQVPVSMRNAEVIWAIRNLLKTKPPNTSLNIIERLEVFDKYWPIKVFVNKKPAYMEDGIIHCYIRERRMSSTEEIKIKDELLRLFVLRQVGQWEETLELLIPHITFRRNKNKPYIVQRRKESICFDKKLYDLSLGTIAYCLFNAVADYVGLKDGFRKELINQHFPTWKTLEKNISYAYATYDNH
ncbi:hypothetical protein C5749_02925 [Sphingobacterium gobiense]|uniref:Uncharacterized protein n=2 Tax=Sphingobacterium gobiense TaxID=1382456 RepID=A0A2S9JSF7_9SPHI|nr:hypothetical protein C5749_02925 [Sphingobacterium gobiense]